MYHQLFYKNDESFNKLKLKNSTNMNGRKH